MSSTATIAAETPVDGHSKHPPVAALILIGALVVGLIVIAFIWPAATAKPQNLPVGISGPQEAITAIETVLAQQDPAPLQLEVVDHRNTAIDRIEARELYGAILLGDTPEVLIASAAGPAPAQALRGIATQLQGQINTDAFGAVTEQLTTILTALQSGQIPQLPPGSGAGADMQIPTVTVTDVVPLAETDTTGAGLSASALPLILGGMLGGALIALQVTGRIRKLVALVSFGVASGVTLTLVMQTWFGLLAGDWLLNTAVVGLGITATASFVTGCAALLGPAGIGLSVIVTLLIANPISGVAMPPEFLPEPWGVVGQGFAPGAAANLLRSVAYFPQAATLPQWLILGAWTIGGAALILISRPKPKTVAA